MAGKPREGLSWNREGGRRWRSSMPASLHRVVWCRAGRQRALFTVRADETPGPPKLFSAKPCQNPEVAVFFGAEAGAHEWEE